MPSMNHTVDVLQVKFAEIDEEGNVSKRFPRIDAEGQLKNTVLHKRYPEYPRNTRELTVPTSVAPARAVVYVPERPADAPLPPVHVNFHGGGFGSVGAVHRVGVDAVGEVGADRALGRLLRIRGPHQLAVVAKPIPHQPVEQAHLL